MKKTILTAVSTAALIALSACAEEAEETTIVESDAEEAVPVDLPATMNGASSADESMAPGADGDTVSISEGGVQADIRDGDTSVRADIDGDPSLTVED